jgi:fibronectin type 3 domain-containing protein
MKSSVPAWILMVAVAAGAVGLSVAVHRRNRSSHHSVTLRWNPSAGATSYKVYRSTASGGRFLRIGATATPTYVDSPVAGGAVFYYVVTAVRDGQESGYSIELKVIVPKASPAAGNSQTQR